MTSWRLLAPLLDANRSGSLRPPSRLRRGHPCRPHRPGQPRAALAGSALAALRVHVRRQRDVGDRFEVATYDQTVRFNITLINNELCIAQPYLPHARGVEAPTMVIKKRWPAAGLYPVFERTFEELWNGGQPR
jgi:hypothetical protein